MEAKEAKRDGNDKKQLSLMTTEGHQIHLEASGLLDSFYTCVYK